MAEIVLTGNVTDLPTAITRLNVPADALMLLERVPTQKLTAAEIADGIKLIVYDGTLTLTQWERGRIFCATWELCWEGERAVYIGLNVALPGFVINQDLSGCVRRRAGYYLWGTRDQQKPQRFIELQIARELYYPLATGKRAKLIVAEWFDGAGQMVASRFTGLEAA